MFLQLASIYLIRQVETHYNTREEYIRIGKKGKPRGVVISCETTRTAEESCADVAGEGLNRHEKRRDETTRREKGRNYMTRGGTKLHDERRDETIWREKGRNYMTREGTKLHDERKDETTWREKGRNYMTRGGTKLHDEMREETTRGGTKLYDEWRE
jgi:hypothetical protein